NVTGVQTCALPISSNQRDLAPPTSSRSPLMSLANRLASGIAFFASRLWRMQEDQRISAQLTQGCRQNVAGADQPSKGMTDWTFLPKAHILEQPIRQGKDITTVVILEIIDAYQLATLKNGGVARHPIRNLCHQLGKMQRRVGIVSHAEEKFLPIEFMDTGDRACRRVRWQGQWIRDDLLCLWPRCRKGKWMGAALYIWQAPECVRDNSKVRCNGRRGRIERLVVQT